MVDVLGTNGGTVSVIYMAAHFFLLLLLLPRGRNLLIKFPFAGYLWGSYKFQLRATNSFLGSS